jgi:Tfp pilus assembly PilM family ATPase
MPETILSLDIGSQSIKAALIRRDRRDALLDTLIARTPDGSVLDGEIAYCGGIVKALSDFIGKAAPPDCVAACVNSPNIITRKVELPAVEAGEIPAAVRFELLKLFPSIKDTHVISQKIVSADSAQVTVFAALCPTSLLSAYAALADGLGVPLKYADTRANAQAKALTRFFGLERDKAGLLVDIGYRGAQISVIVGGNAVVSRHVAAGAAAFDAMLAGKAGISTDDAGSARLNGDFSALGVDATELSRAQDACFAEIAEQVRQTADFYNYEQPKAPLEFISVIGEGGLIPNINGYFAEPLGLRQLELPAAPAGIPADGPNAKLLISAIGAGLREGDRACRDINFVEKPEYGQGRGNAGAMGKFSASMAAAALILVISILISVYYYVSRVTATREAESIIAALSGGAGVSELERRIADAELRLADADNVAAAMESAGVRASDVLGVLSASAPENLFVVNCSIMNASEIMLAGKSKDYGSIADFALLIRENGAYGSVAINSITANRSTSEDIVDYGFTMTLRS